MIVGEIIVGPGIIAPRAEKHAAAVVGRKLSDPIQCITSRTIGQVRGAEAVADHPDLHLSCMRWRRDKDEKHGVHQRRPAHVHGCHSLLFAQNAI